MKIKILMAKVHLSHQREHIKDISNMEKKMVKAHLFIKMVIDT